MFQFSSIIITVAASLCRCITIYFKIFSQTFYTTRNCVKLLISIFIISAILSTPYWFRYQMITSFNSITNTTEYYLAESSVSKQINNVHIFLTIVMYAVPLICLLIVNTLLISVLTKTRRRKITFGLENRNEKSTTIILILVIIWFFICNMPNFILSIFIMLEKNQKDIYMIQLHQVANFLIIVNYSSNFAIYCSIGKKFRNTAKLIFQGNNQETIANNNQIINENTVLKDHTNNHNQIINENTALKDHTNNHNQIINENTVLKDHTNNHNQIRYH
jgi:hypothetical protein